MLSQASSALVTCYQCGKCTAGCPVAERMDLSPNQILRLVQLGQEEKAIRSSGIWLCVSCLTCVARCPKSLGCAAAFDMLREKAVREGKVNASQHRVVLFYREFLKNVRKNGRLHEADLVGRYKLLGFAKDFRVHLLLKDATLAPRLMRRGRFSIKAQPMRDLGIVERIFQRCAQPTNATDDSVVTSEETV